MKYRMGRHIGLVFCLVLGVIVVGVQLATSLESQAVGPAQQVSVIDGDTFQLNGKTIQLYGIDAPELGQLCLHDHSLERCGLSAAFELKKLLSIEHGPLECRPAKGADDPALQICIFGHTDVARALLEGGYAVTTADTSPAYAEAQDSARQGALGLWHSRYIDPKEWRAGKRLAQEAGDGRGPCPIKAVVAPDGHRLYYVPTDAQYEAIVVDPARGDQLYCSDEDARRDGWRRAGEAS